MKGILKHTTAGWFVWYSVQRDEITSGYKSIPVHPKYTRYYFLEMQDVDSIVDFEIVKEYVDNSTNQVQKYAKLITNKVDLQQLEKIGRAHV